MKDIKNSLQRELLHVVAGSTAADDQFAVGQFNGQRLHPSPGSDTIRSLMACSSALDRAWLSGTLNNPPSSGFLGWSFGGSTATSRSGNTLPSIGQVPLLSPPWIAA